MKDQNEACQTHGGKLIMDHTLREFSDCHPSKDLNLPFEESEKQMMPIGDRLAGGLVVLAAAVETPLGKIPTLIFRFVEGDGLTFYPDITLVADNKTIQGVATLVQRSASKAIQAARR